ncbi:dockerin-containing iron ABC transporter substrate-binding protein [methanogenic archaeon mixed culture ISO4-G1]|nr:dockerin-containing iron ABC transporter substrate-binding protein [methanogenic archaeon mixed culture ISO4-G1]
MNTKVLAVIVVAVLVVAGAGVFFMMKPASVNAIDVELEVFGNADKDGKVDSADADLLKKYIDARDTGNTDAVKEAEEKMSLRFADANLDGKIDMTDYNQVKAIADGTAKKVWLLDGFGNEREISREIQKIGCEYFANTELCLILGLVDKIYAVDYAPYQYKDFYFDESKAATVKTLDNMNEPNYDDVNKLDLDILLTFYNKQYDAKQDKIYGCDVLYLGCYLPDITNTEKSSFIQGVLKAGYVFNVVDRATQYANWLLDYRDKLLNIANSIPEADKPTILASNLGSGYFGGGVFTLTAYKLTDPLGQGIKLGGGHNVVDDVNEKDITKNGTNGITVNIDTVLGTNTTVKFILLHMVKYTYGGSEQVSTPHHGHVYSVADEKASGELATALAEMEAMDLVEDDMNVSLLAGEFRNGCTAGVLLGAYIGKLCNPDKYASINPIKMTAEYYDWMGIKDKDPAQDAVYVYPLLSA